jgi:hypothetical protein
MPFVVTRLVIRAVAGAAHGKHERRDNKQISLHNDSSLDVTALLERQSSVVLFEQTAIEPPSWSKYRSGFHIGTWGNHLASWAALLVTRCWPGLLYNC